MKHGSLLFVCFLVLISSTTITKASTSRIANALYAALALDERLEWMYSAFRVDSNISDWLTESPLTLIAPTDNAFMKALRQRRLLCEQHQPCMSFRQYLTSPLLESTLLSQIHWGDINLETVTSDRRFLALSGVLIKVERRQEWDLRIGGAPVVQSTPEINFEYGKIIVVDDILINYSHMNTSFIESAEFWADIGPLRRNQRNSMIEVMVENIDSFRKIRSIKLLNTSSFPLTFKPVHHFQKQQYSCVQCQKCSDKTLSALDKSQNKRFQSSFEGSDITWNIPKNTKLPRKKSDLAFMSILELASLLRQELVTSTELTIFYLSRMKRLDKYVEAVINYTEELAMKEAEKADQEFRMGIYKSPLQGIPYGLKDLIAVPGYPTTWGSKALKNQIINEEAWVYKKLADSGAVHVTKLATGAMAWGDVWFGGRTKNPWNIEKGSCGSSSGSGAAAVAGFVPFSIGTETWGSISCPASNMGITAIRPTFGSIGRSGIMPLAWSLDKIGTFCRNALDCAIVLDGLRGVDAQDSSSVSAPLTNPLSIKPEKLIVGYTRNTNQKVVKEFQRLGLKMMLIDIDVDYPVDAIINVLLGAEASSNFDRWIRENKLSTLTLDEGWISFIQGARLIPAAEYLMANKIRSRLIELGEDIFKMVDAVLIPSSKKGNQVTLGNLIGIPEVIFPTGYLDIKGYETSSRKNPQTQALIGAPFTDGQLLGIVVLYQNLTNYHLSRPPIHKVVDHVLVSCLPFSHCTLKVIHCSGM